MRVHRLSDELHDECLQIILYIPHLILIFVLQELNDYHPGGALHPSYKTHRAAGGLACYPRRLFIGAKKPSLSPHREIFDGPGQNIKFRPMDVGCEMWDVKGTGYKVQGRTLNLELWTLYLGPCTGILLNSGF